MTAASGPASIDRLARSIARCRACRLHEGRTHAVPGEGPPHPEAMLIGEAPGEQEDLLARPFVGPSGRVLDALFQECSLSREDLFITSSVKCRPPKNRNPKTDELATCKATWLDAQISALDPPLVLLLGSVALRCVLGPIGRMKDLHGSVHSYRHRHLLITYHPSAALRFPWARRAMQQDLALLTDMLSSNPSDRASGRE